VKILQNLAWISVLKLNAVLAFDFKTVDSVHIGRNTHSPGLSSATAEVGNT